MPAKIDLVDKKFGRLQVISFHGNGRTSGGESKRFWNCLCECGATSIVITSALTSGNTQSCGCLQKEVVTLGMTQHGASETPEYKALLRIRNRTGNPNVSNFDIYGKLGMEEMWKTSFEEFLKEIGEMPKDGQRWSVGRIDNDIGYFIGNIRWETDDLQSRNHSMQDNNTSGKTGVKWQKKKGIVVAAIASCELLTGKRKSKSFSVGKYGKEKAFELACIARDEMISELNLQGAGYAEKHGK